MILPENFHEALSDTLKSARNIEGYLSEREMKFLFLLSACPTTEGSVLEIGSFKGKSTVILARASGLIDNTRLIAVDPLNSPSVTDPSLKGKESGLEDFQNNLKMAGIENKVEFHQMLSHELAKRWRGRLRLLWIDGDHTYHGTKTDFDLFSPFLSDRAIIAFHDVLALAGFNGPLRVFMESILLSAKFGAHGIVGTIGWAQYLTEEGQALRYKEERLRLYLKLSRLIPLVSSQKPLQGLKKMKYKLLRAGIPHPELTPEEWLKKVQI